MGRFRRSICGCASWLLAAAALVAGLSGCSWFGVPDFPAELAAPLSAPGELFVVYDPDSVLGFGHTGLIVASPDGGGFHRFDQYASSEIDYELRDREGKTRFWEAFTARLPPLVGATREYVTRRRARSARELVYPNEFAVPVNVKSEARRAIHAAAEERFRDASILEALQARRYYLLTNNCQSFLIDLLRSGGLPEDDFFPKHMMENYLAQYRQRLERPRAAAH